MFRNIFQNLKQDEDEVLEKELLYEISNTPNNWAALYLAQANLKKSLKLEEDYWCQKSHLQWLKEGEGNTKLFHSIVQQTKCRMHFHKIVDLQGNTLEAESDIKEAVITYFKAQL